MIWVVVIIGAVLALGAITLFVQKSKVLYTETPTCPQCQSAMTKRTGPYGEFFGCSRYPDCKGTRRIANQQNRQSDAGTSERK